MGSGGSPVVTDKVLSKRRGGKLYTVRGRSGAKVQRPLVLGAVHNYIGGINARLAEPRGQEQDIGMLRQYLKTALGLPLQFRTIFGYTMLWRGNKVLNMGIEL